MLKECLSSRLSRMPGRAQPAQIANIIFNETRSLTGVKISQARAYIARAIINSQSAGHKLPKMAPHTAHVPPQEKGIYHDCLTAVQAARSEKHDPTGGATHFNFRNGGSQANFEGLLIKTSVGPLNNSYPTHALPAQNIYANTYE